MLPNYTLRIIFEVRIESAKRLTRSLGLNIDREPLVLLNECCWLNAGVEECIPVVSAVARVSEAPPEISRGAPHTLLAYYYKLQ